MHRDHCNLFTTPVGVEARGKNSAAMRDLRNAWSGTTSGVQQVLSRSSRGDGVEGNIRDRGQSVPAGHHELDESGIDVDMWVPVQHVGSG